ncbi:MAG TPA: hypothetical protein VE175_01390, partial [Woeseiaceae bacterium]|nr:hypothetical protein [Woeseiaceae bacterium]
QIDEAAAAEVIDAGEAASLRDYHDKVFAILSVDDFAPDDIGRAAVPEERPRAAARAKTAGKKKTVRRKKAEHDPDH